MRIPHKRESPAHFALWRTSPAPQAWCTSCRRCSLQEIYNLAAQGHVQVSFEQPEYTANSDALGTLRLLEAIRILGLSGKTRFYQASTSEMYGLVQEVPQTEKTPAPHPRSPYGAAKLYAYWITVNYAAVLTAFMPRNGILFSHEVPAAREKPLSRARSRRALARIKLGLQQKSFIYWESEFCKRDWGHARDYMSRDAMADAAAAAGFGLRDRYRHPVQRSRLCDPGRRTCLDIHLRWEGLDGDEQGYDQHGNAIVAVDPRYFRPAEVESLLGDATKARRELGWIPRIDFPRAGRRNGS